MFNPIKSKITWKVFFSFLLVSVLVIGILLVSVRVNIARTVTRRLENVRLPQNIQDAVIEPEKTTNQGPGHGSGQPNLLRAVPALLNEIIEATNETMFYGFVIAVLFAAVAGIVLSQQIVSPVKDLTEASQKIAEGDYSHRLPVSGSITEEKDELGQLADSFNYMASELEQTEARRQQLIGDVSHELRTPLTTIKGFMEALMDEKMPPTAETFQQIYSETDRLQRLVNDLQELSRVEAGAYELRIQEVSIKTLFDSVDFLLKNQYEEKGVSLEFALENNNLTAAMDEQRIGQVLINLLGNALQFTPAGGSVQLRAVKTGSSIQIDVTDTGVGLSPENLELIFSRFYRADKSRARAFGGSGIGLTIAKHLVEAHGGRLWAASAGINQGSTFSFTIPAD